MSPFLFLGVLFTIGYGAVTTLLLVAYFRSEDPLRLSVIAFMPAMAGYVFMLALIHPRQSYRAVIENV